MSTRASFAVVLLCVVSLAQQPSAGPEERVLVSLIAKGDKQWVVSGLSMKCDGKPVQIKAIDRARPIRFVLVFDRSNSTRDLFRLYQYGAIQLLREFKPEDEGAVLTFDSRVNEEPKLTADYQGFIPDLQSARPGGGTAVFDALVVAAEMLGGGPPDRPRVIFLFSDGDDNQSLARETDVLAALSRDHISVISFYEGDRDYSNRAGDDRLHHFAAYGGEVLYPNGNVDGMKSALQNVRQYLDGLRWITFAAQQAPSSHAELQLKAAGAKVIAPKHCAL